MKGGTFRNWLIPLLGLALAIPALAGGFEDMENRVVEKTLDNGIRVILLPRPKAPVISMVTYADVGAVNEHVGITGMAHMFEHMAFKGTSTIGTNDIKKEREAMDRLEEAYMALKTEQIKGRSANAEMLERLEEAFQNAQEEAAELSNSEEFTEILEREGCPDLNAFTGFDQTVYPYSLPSNKLELWAALESERFTDPVLREFYKERDVVMEERRLRFESQPTGKLFEEFLGVAFRAHPYGKLGIGHMSDLQNLTRRQADDWFAKYYKGKNLILAVVGDVDPKKAMPIIEKYFGRIPAGEKTPVVTTVEPPQKGERRVYLEDPSQPFLLMGFHKPDINHPDNAAYEALNDILSGGRTSRIYKALVKEKKLALFAGSFTQLGQKYPGLFVFISVPNQGKTSEENEKAIWEEIKRIQNEPVTAEELEGMKARARADFFASLQSNLGIGLELAQNQALRGTWRGMFRQLEELDRVTPDDIQRVARETFLPTNLTVAEIRTSESK